MRLDRKETLQALARIRGAVSSRPGIPALTGVLVDVDGGAATFTATDLEVSCRVRVALAEGPAGGWHNGPALIPARMLEASVKASKAAEVDLIVGELAGAPGTVAVDGVHVLRLLEADDFPGLVPGAESFDRFDAQAFAEIVRRVAPAASRDDARPVLTGVLLEVGAAGGATLTATDSYRLHSGELDGGGDRTPGAGWSVIVPERTLSAVAKSIGRKGAGSVGIGLPDGPAGGSVEFRYGSTVWTSRVIEGEFPNYRQLMPDADAADTVVRVDTAELAALVKAAGAYCGKAAGEGGPVTITANGRVMWSASSADLGAFGPVELGSYVGEPVAAGFNPFYLADTVAATAEDGRATSLELRSGLKPCVLRGAGVVALVMPVRLPAAVTS